MTDRKLAALIAVWVTVALLTILAWAELRGFDPALCDAYNTCWTTLGDMDPWVCSFEVVPADIVVTCSVKVTGPLNQTCTSNTAAESATTTRVAAAARRTARLRGLATCASTLVAITWLAR